MNAKPATPSFVNLFSKFVHEIGYALFVSNDKREFQRLKNFITS